MLMKKRRKIKPHKDNIFLFPDVDKLLMRKGLTSLHNKKFSEAIGYLEEALALDPDNDEITLGLIIAYFETGNLTTAKQLAYKSMKQGVGDYFQLIDIYIMILLQMNEYEEIVSTIEALLDEREIPREKWDNFTRILEFSRRKLEAESTLLHPTIENETVDFDLFQYENLNDQFLAVARLSHLNARSYLNGIKEYLNWTDGHPFIKTMLLQLLKEQEVDAKLDMEKFQQRLTINPVELKEIEQVLSAEEIMNFIKSEIEQDNPSLFESIREMVSRHSFLLFPIERKPSDPRAWAAAYHFIVLEYFGIPHSIEKLVPKYETQTTLVSEAIGLIRELEEISSPII
jgi:tetratricopeptide (TPR) repeat protein